MNEEPDLYSILGVAPTSEDVVIQAAYRALMRRYHPDTNPSPEAALKCVEINKAYSILSSHSERAAYDKRRAEGPTPPGANGASPPPPPPPPDPHESMQQPQSDARTRSRSPVAILFYVLLIVGSASIAGFAVVRSSGFRNASQSAPTMNVDENLTTTDMNVDENLTTTDMNATDLNATDMNAVVAKPLPTDLSQQVQSPVSYSTIEAAASKFAKVLTSKGISGARAYSEQCHKAVQGAPTWDGADGCAAFDFAAASIDNAVSNSGGFPRNGYFEFQQSNQADNYAAVGAPSYSVVSRLAEIKHSAEESAADAVRNEIARQRESSSSAVTPHSSPDSVNDDNSISEKPE